MTINKLKIKKNESCVIIGETGSGKSCLIKSLIDRLIILSKKEFNIDGIISYASQTPFIINASVKENILFYSEYDEERYNQVIKYCQLEKDIESFPAQDQTEIGTNGANLSGGQKSRINLARCAYKDADIYLFDDPISSVDAIVYNKILNELIKNFLKDKTVIFASNDILPIIDIKLLRDSRTGRSKNCCYVEFDTKDRARQAINLTGQLLCGQPCQIVPSQAEKNRQALAHKLKKEKDMDNYIELLCFTIN